MYKHILIATDGSELAGKAIAAGFDLARELAAQVTVVTVAEPLTALLTGDAAIGFPVDEYEKSADESASQILSGAAKLARKADIRCTTVHAKDQYPAEGILEAAKKNGCDLIVMASHGRRGLGRLILGSQAAKVVTEHCSRARLPVAVTGIIHHVQAPPDRDGRFCGGREGFGARPYFGQSVVGKGDHCHR